MRSVLPLHKHANTHTEKHKVISSIHKTKQDITTLKITQIPILSVLISYISYFDNLLTHIRKCASIC